ncbi:MAG: trypsin-like peptidase domain-containing protein [Candidatus Paceibacterota bacterium]|jgi:hypothetical protein|nr:hypothetical protein [Candidatus Paceibacterota bacterium]
MEDLTKQQMVLLTVLVSFVCSIATSIMIVSLLTDTTPIVSQTINNIVEKTIEKVVTGTTTPVVIKPTTPTPIKTENERIISAVQINLPKLVSIREKAIEGGSATGTAKIGIGSIVSADGLIAVDSSMVGEKTEFTVFFGDKYRPAKKVYADNASHVALIQAGDAIKGDKNTEGITFSPLSYSRSDMTLGLPMIALGGENGRSMTKGTLTEMPDDKTSPIASEDMSLSDAYKGGIVFGQDGKVIGFILSSSIGDPEIIPYSNILSAINQYKSPTAEAAKP